MNPCPSPALPQPIRIPSSRQAPRPELLLGNKTGSRRAGGNIAFHSVHQQKWINIRQGSSEQWLGKISPRGQESYIDREIIPKGNIIILVSLLSPGCYFTTPVIQTMLQTKFTALETCRLILPARLSHLWVSGGPCCSPG